MKFSETYRHEVYLSRKDRARRVLFAAKIVAITLVITIGATLRAEPELRRALMTAGMDGVAHFADLPDAQDDFGVLAALGQSDEKTRGADQLPTSRVKVNRGGRAATLETADTATQLGEALSQIRPGG